MKPGARIQAVIELIDAVDEVDKPADSTVSGYFRSRRFIGSKDRKVIAAMFYDLLRHRNRLHWWLERQQLEQNGRHLVMAFLVLVQHYNLDRVKETFDGDKFCPSRMLFEEKGCVRKWVEVGSIDHPDMDDAVRLECPAWAYEPLKDTLGAELETELVAMMEPAKLHLRVNVIHTDAKAVLKELSANGIEAKRGQYATTAIEVDGRPPISALDLFKNGRIEIQDEGSQLLAELVDAKPGMQVFDFCAGAGGKTLAIAAQMDNKGRIIATDVLGGRLTRSKQRFRRADVHNIETHAIEHEHDKWLKRKKGKFDRVLADVPCSGTGTWKRNPDMRWKHLGPNLEELLTVQQSILSRAALLVRPGGRLVYGTCSLLNSENEDQIEAFLEDHPEFERISAHDVLAGRSLHENPTDGEYLKMRPSLHGTDGFFGAVLRRKGEDTE